MVRGWQGDGAERGIVVHQVWVATVLERTDWLRELRQLATQEILRLRAVALYPPEQAADAQLRMTAGGLRGRCVIVF